MELKLTKLVRFSNGNLVMEMLEKLTFEELKNVADFIIAHEKELRQLESLDDEKRDLLVKFRKEVYF